jgi:hypothetical protein
VKNGVKFAVALPMDLHWALTALTLVLRMCGDAAAAAAMLFFVLLLA